MYTQYRRIKASECVVLPQGVSAAEGAAFFVNPMTALSLVETMRMEGYRGMVHTAAASVVGQMLVRICAADGVPLVNVVRSPQQVALLRGLGAIYVVDSSSPSFMEDLVDAIVATGATAAFDAVSGGELPNQLLVAMEAAVNRDVSSYTRYGNAAHKQVYIYGGLDPRPTVIDRSLWPVLWRRWLHAGDILPEDWRWRQRATGEKSQRAFSRRGRCWAVRPLRSGSPWPSPCPTVKADCVRLIVRRQKF